MACVNPDGTVTEMARKVLAAIGQGATAEQVAQVAGAPLYRVRATTRELVAAGLVVESGGAWTLTEAGRARLPTG